MEFIYYAADYVALRNDLPMRKFAALFAIYGLNVAPVDRTGTIKLPVNTHSLFPLPKLKKMTKTYEEVCDERARDLLATASDFKVPIYLFWSGGVDSTCALISLVKAAGKHTDMIVVLLSEDSIGEYPLFYERFIRGKLACRSSITFPHMLGAVGALLVNGEGNDQLFGSDVIADAIREFGIDAVQADYDAELFRKLFERRMRGDTAVADFYVQLFERLRAVAPVPIESNFDHLWWINFALKWQTVYMRTLSRAKVPGLLPGITKEWVERYYAPFYMTDRFQLWSLHNIDKRMSSNWSSYKFPAKELIYKFTKDPVYRDGKIKRGSLAYLISHHNRANFITSDYAFPQDVEPAEFYREDHDFR